MGEIIVLTLFHFRKFFSSEIADGQVTQNH